MVLRNNLSLSPIRELQEKLAKMVFYIVVSCNRVSGRVGEHGWEVGSKGLEGGRPGGGTWEERW